MDERICRAQYSAVPMSAASEPMGGNNTRVFWDCMMTGVLVSCG